MWVWVGCETLKACLLTRFSAKNCRALFDCRLTSSKRTQIKSFIVAFAKDVKIDNLVCLFMTDVWSCAKNFPSFHIVAVLKRS